LKDGVRADGRPFLHSTQGGKFDLAPVSCHCHRVQTQEEDQVKD
jgi:hypothetical protein